MEEQYIPTGNERISIPKLSMVDGAIHDFTFLHMGYKGLIDVRGTDINPLMKPVLRANGAYISLQNLRWERENWWIPIFSASCANFNVKGIILAPIGERGFIYRLEISNPTAQSQTVEVGLEGCWDSTFHCINEDKAVASVKHAYMSDWNSNIVFDLRNGVSVFSFAPMTSQPCQVEFLENGPAITYSLYCPMTLIPGEAKSLDFYWGIGFEEVASTTSAKEMLRQGYPLLFEKTVQWLKQRSHSFKDNEISSLYHTNLFFNFFFATGITMDTEELVLVTSRSPRYYVSAAYWDRDSLLWSFPSILMADANYARDMLDYVFTRQIRNVGIHSRYIDGTVLEPGFELDELCAPIIALYHYIEVSGDKEYLHEPYIIKGVRRILNILETKKHPTIDLYETFLQPTDDMHIYPYITYDNVLVWCSLNHIASMFIDIFEPEVTASLIKLSEKLKTAIHDNCIKEFNGKRIYGWSVDLKGNFDVYDEPPGSLQLLAFLNFCDKEDEVFLNTVEVIRNEDYPYSFSNTNFPETGCPHAPHPWVLSVANSLLYGRIEHCRSILKRIRMDNLIACESVDEHTGECVTGAAFATCAGFLAYTMRLALE